MRVVNPLENYRSHFGAVRNCVDFDSLERCVDGSWETISLTNEDLAWSCVTPGTMNHDDATVYCADNGGRLPTISELRTLIQNCPETKTGGACEVTDTCLNSSDCWNDACDGCSSDDSGKYNVFGISGLFWSSSVLSDREKDALCVYFKEGRVTYNGRDYKGNVWCVK